VKRRIASGHDEKPRGSFLIKSPVLCATVLRTRLRTPRRITRSQIVARRSHHRAAEPPRAPLHLLATATSCGAVRDLSEEASADVVVCSWRRVPTAEPAPVKAYAACRS